MNAPRRRRPGRQRRHAFMIISMLVALGLIAGFVIVSERLFRLTLQTTTQSTRRQEDLIRQERALHHLRDDVWSAATTPVEVKDPATLRIGGIQWTTSPEGIAVRTQRDKPGEEARWSDLHLSFARQGPWVVVGRAGKEIALLRTAPSPSAAGGAK